MIQYWPAVLIVDILYSLRYRRQISGFRNIHSRIWYPTI